MTEPQIKARIEELRNDPQLCARTATIFENALLALIQVSLEKELWTLEKVLGTWPTDINKLRNEKSGKEAE